MSLHAMSLQARSLPPAVDAARPGQGARVVAYRCTTHDIFRILWPEVDAPLVHPCPACAGAALRLISTRPDAA